MQAADVTSVQYTDLLSGGPEIEAASTEIVVAKVSRPLTVAAVRRAFGAEGLGILAVQQVPGLAPLRQRVLQAAWQFGKQAPEVQRQYEVGDCER